MATRKPPEPAIEYDVTSTIVDDRLVVDEKTGGRLRIEPGARYTHTELLGFGWAEEDIENLIECGALALAEED